MRAEGRAYSINDPRTLRPIAVKRLRCPIGRAFLADRNCVRVREHEAVLKIKVGLAIVSIILSTGLNADSAQRLDSQASVLDALSQSRGDAVLAFIDSSADQSSAVRNLQGLLSTYLVELNGTDLGSIRRNTVIQVRPRLGLNRLKLTNAFDKSQSTEVTFPAMRSAGVSTSLIEIQTSRQFSWIQALTLSSAEVQLIEEALKRSQHGGMNRVLALIRARGKEIVPQKIERVNWRRGIVDSSDPGPDSGYLTSGERLSEAAISESNTAREGGPESIDTLQPPAESPNKDVSEAAKSGLSPNISAGKPPAASTDESEATESESSSSVSADRRSYY